MTVPERSASIDHSRAPVVASDGKVKQKGGRDSRAVVWYSPPAPHFLDNIHVNGAHGPNDGAPGRGK